MLGGSLNSQKCYTGWRQWLKTMFEDLYALSCTTLCWKYVQYVKKKSVAYVVCTKYSCVQSVMYKKIFVCTKKYFTWCFKNLLLLCLDSSKNLWFDAFIKMMIWGATEQSKESFLVSIITLQDTSIRYFLVTNTDCNRGARSSRCDWQWWKMLTN